MAACLSVWPSPCLGLIGRDNFDFVLPHQLVSLPSVVLLCVCLCLAATARVAKGVECAMNENIPYLSKKSSYLDKARQLVFNLKKNDQLRCSTVP